jgi:adhesin transport system outer membrane protein
MMTHKNILALMLLAWAWMGVATAQEAKGDASQAEVDQKAQVQTVAEPDNAIAQEAEKKSKQEEEAKAAEQARLDAEWKASGDAAKVPKQPVVEVLDLPKQESAEEQNSGAKADQSANEQITEQAKQKVEAKAKAEADAEAANQARLDAEVEAVEQVGIEAEAKAAEQAKQEAEAQAKAEADAKVAEQAKADAEAKAADQARIEAEAKAAEQAKQNAEAQAKAEADTKEVEQAKADAEAKAAEQARIETEAKAAEQTKQEAEAKAKAEAETSAAAAAQAKTEVEAKATEQTKLDAEAKAAEQVKTEAEPKAAEQAKQEAEAKAKVEADAKIAEQAKEEAETKAKAEIDAKAAEQVKLEAEAKATEQARLDAEVKAKPKKQKIEKPNPLLEAVQKAVLKNPDVLSRWHSFLAAVKEADSARGGYFPRVDLSVDKGRERYQAGNVDPTLLNRKGVSLTLTQMLYDGFATRNEVRRLTNAELTRYYELLDASESAALEAIRAYYDVARYRKLFELTQDNYVTHRTAYEQIRQKVQAGVGRRVDLEQATGRVALSESNMVLDNANVHDVGARYQRIIGELPPPDLDDSFSRTIQGKLEKMILPHAEEATLSVAVESHPAILAAVENVRSAKYDLYERWGKYQPTVNLRVSESKETNYTGVLGPTNDAVAEVVLSWNLFNGGADRARSGQFANRLEVARDQRDKTCRDVRQTLAIAYNDVWKLHDQLDFLDQHQTTIEKAHLAYQKQFEIGQRSLLDVLDSENELFQAKRSYLNAEYDLYIAHARTLAGMGKLASSLGLARLETPELPELLGLNSEGPENCLPEAPLLNNINMDELNARAIEAAKPPERPAEPDQPVPASGVPGVPVLGSQADLDAKAAAEAELFMQNPNEIKAAQTAKTKAAESKTKHAKKSKATQIKVEKKAKDNPE